MGIQDLINSELEKEKERHRKLYAFHQTVMDENLRLHKEVLDLRKTVRELQEIKKSKIPANISWGAKPLKDVQV